MIVDILVEDGVLSSPQVAGDPPSLRFGVFSSQRVAEYLPSPGILGYARVALERSKFRLGTLSSPRVGAYPSPAHPRVAGDPRVLSWLDLRRILPAPDIVSPTKSRGTFLKS